MKERIKTDPGYLEKSRKDLIPAPDEVKSRTGRLDNDAIFQEGVV